MSAIGKANIGYRKLDRTTDKGLAIGQKRLVCAHQFTSSGVSTIDLTNLNTPAAMAALGFVNPNTANILAANIYNLRDNVKVISSIHGLLMDYSSYLVTTNSLIVLQGAAVSTINEIIMIYIEPVNMSGIIGVDGQAIVQTGTIAAGSTNIVLSSGYFTYNKYSTQQIGDVSLYLDGVLQMRNVGNSTSASVGGNYYELAPGSGNLSNTLVLNVAPVGTAKNYSIVSNGLVAERPTAAVLSAVQGLATSVYTMIQDLALLTGNPTSTYAGLPSVIDQAMFGNKVNSFISGIHYDAVVGNSTQLAAGQVTHTSLQAAINSVATGSSILILNQTFVENITISKQVDLMGKGRNSFINGTLTLNSGASYCSIMKIKFGGNIVINVGVNSCFVRDCWQATGLTITNSGTANSVLVDTE